MKTGNEAQVSPKLTGYGKWIKGNEAQVSPELTGYDEWIEGEIINIENNPFLGTEIAIMDNLGRIFFGEEKYFKLLN